MCCCYCCCYSGCSGGDDKGGCSGGCSGGGSSSGCCERCLWGCVSCTDPSKPCVDTITMCNFGQIEAPMQQNDDGTFTCLNDGTIYDGCGNVFGKDFSIADINCVMNPCGIQNWDCFWKEIGMVDGTVADNNKPIYQSSNGTGKTATGAKGQKQNNKDKSGGSGSAGGGSMGSGGSSGGKSSGGSQQKQKQNPLSSLGNGLLNFLKPKPQQVMNQQLACQQRQKLINRQGSLFDKIRGSNSNPMLYLTIGLLIIGIITLVVMVRKNNG